jgi:hypothetical protein
VLDLVDTHPTVRPAEGLSNVSNALGLAENMLGCGAHELSDRRRPSVLTTPTVDEGRVSAVGSLRIIVGK